MRVFAIDPGPEESGWALVDGDALLRSGTTPNHDLFVQGEPDVLAIEMIASYGMAVGKEVFETCVWVGRFVERRQPYPYVLVYRKDVKLYVCESPKATDAMIRQALVDRYGGKKKAIGDKKSPGPLYRLKGDAWSAFAVALTAQTLPATLDA